MVTPSKSEILKQAKRLDMMSAVGQGLPAITAEELELKEGGTFHEAQHDLMRSEESRHRGEQERYLKDMAGEMGLRLLEKKEFSEAKKGMKKLGFEWTNGWSHKKKVKAKVKPKPTTKIPSPSTLKNIESLIHLEQLTDKQLVKRLKQLRATKKAWIEGRLSNKYYRGVMDAGGVTGKVPKDVFLFTNLDPTIEDFKKELIRRSARTMRVQRKKPAFIIPKIEAKPKPKRTPIQRVSLRKPLNIGSSIRGRAMVKPKKRHWGTCPECFQTYKSKRGLAFHMEMFHKKKPKPKKKHVPTIKSPAKIILPKPKKKRKRNHTERTGKTMRKLRGINGVKVFSFPDYVWKVHKPRKKR